MRVSIIMPGYKHAGVLEKTYLRIPEEHRQNVIFCDDAGGDDSLEKN